MSSSTISRQSAKVSRSSSLPSGEKLERRLEELLHEDRFAPPAQFVAAARAQEE